MDTNEAGTTTTEPKPRRRRQPCDGELMDQPATCWFFGNIHPSTLWRGIAAGRYPKPIKTGPNTNRWLRTECGAARDAMIAERDGTKAAS
jgi:predicted DNA-binding transcriptional regulator AlpA